MFYYGFQIGDWGQYINVSLWINLLYMQKISEYLVNRIEQVAVMMFHAVFKQDNKNHPP